MGVSVFPAPSASGGALPQGATANVASGYTATGGWKYATSTPAGTYQVSIQAPSNQIYGIETASGVTLNEIEGGLNAEQKLAERYQLLKGQVNDQQKLIGLQKVQIKVGKSDYYQLYQQQLSLASYQFNLLRLQNERLIQRVNLHLALGGVYPI